MPIVVVCPKFPDAFNLSRVLEDIKKRLPYLNDRTMLNHLMAFAVVGAGFNNIMEKYITELSDDEIHRIGFLQRRWQGNRTTLEFYKDLFENYGYTCEQLFGICFYGYEQFNCCDKFEPYYMMLRGRCFKFKGMFQIDPDVVGRLFLFLKQVPSHLSSSPKALQPQIVFYLSNNYWKYRNLEIGTFPRFYLQPGDAFHIRIKGRLIRMLPHDGQCSVKKDLYNCGTYFVRKWHRKKVLQPLNCTLFYLASKLSREYPICSPEAIVREYNNLNELRSLYNDSERCKPACRRFDHMFTLFRSDNSDHIIEFDKNSEASECPLPPFRIEVSFTNLEVEKYEEVYTLTPPGFIAQLGGQFGLFMGISIGTFLQLFVWGGSSMLKSISAESQS